MSSHVLPTVRLPALVTGDGIEGDIGMKEVSVVDLPPSNKFGFAWPADATPAAVSTLGDNQPSLTSSDVETDTSEDGPAPDPQPPGEFPADSEYTPTNRLSTEEDPLEAQSIPRLSRAFSMPVASQLGHLKNPRRVASSASDDYTPSPVIQLTSELSHLHELSLELADSVQLVTQTLLQLSPPQVLDPAKEQFSACSVSIPTPSISAMFTTVKNLNYMSANMAAFSSLPSSSASTPFQSMSSSVSSTIEGPLFESSDFDIGEMLQSVGDAVGGLAAEAGVDVVLYHGDVGMKHIAVRGDECGVSYTLTHLVRQVIATSRRGDSIEIGLFVSSASLDSASETSSETGGMPASRSSAEFLHGRVRCTFDIAHKFYFETHGRAGSFSEELTSRPSTPTQRPEPNFKSIVLRSLLKHLDATFAPDLPPKLFSFGRACELTLTLDTGDHASVNPSIVVPPEDARSAVYPNLQIASEPTLEELSQFAETLRGKKVTLYASSKGSFAHHLTSYLTAWGLDVSHVSHETGEGIPEADEASEASSDSAALAPATGGSNLIYGTHNVITPPLGLGMEGMTPQGQPDPQQGRLSTSPTSINSLGGPPVSFIFIDDNVGVLRERLRKLRSEQMYGGLNMHTRKRPSLAANHRPRSSPQVVRSLGLLQQGASPCSTVIVHFTSLSNFKLVRDVVQSVLTTSSAPNARVPEVIVIPKPAGPRRFLTALHTAVTKPIVDPFFSPIATSPMSPGLHSHPPFFNTSPSSPSAKPSGGSGSSRTNSDRSARSPKDMLGDPMNLPLPSPLSMSDGMEYFADAAVKLGTSPSTGLVIQSPDGQPAGIFFHPKRTLPKPTPGGYPMERGPSQMGVSATEHRARRAGSRRTSDPYAGTHVGTPNSVAAAGRRPTVIAEEAVVAASPSTGSVRGKRAKAPTAADEERAALAAVAAPVTPVISADPKFSPTLHPRGDGPQRRTSQATPPVSPRTDPTTGTPPGTSGRATRRRATHRTSATPPPAAPLKKGTLAGDTNIVPPISVLVVDDNPINQTILSTFMRKKKIKYDVAKNGQEAVTKWRSGGFHLILMDIQMPVMDGIEATKEIRRLEKSYGSAGPGTPISDLEQRTPSDIASSDSKNAATPYRSSVIIVALTASSLQSDRVAALAAGCNDFLTKPVSLLWLNNKIIEWGSIKALQMWADLRPEVVKSISNGQAVQAQNVARKLHVPEGRATPTAGGSRSSSLVGRKAPAGSTAEPSQPAPKMTDIIAESLPSKIVAALKESARAGGDTTPTPSDYPGVIVTEPTPKGAPGGGGGSVAGEAEEAPLPEVAPRIQEVVPEPEALSPPVVDLEPVRAELPPTDPPAGEPMAEKDDLTPSTAVDDTPTLEKPDAAPEPEPADMSGTVPGGTTEMLSEKPAPADDEDPGVKGGPSD